MRAIDLVADLGRVVAAERAKVLDLPPLNWPPSPAFGSKPAFAQFFRHFAF